MRIEPTYSELAAQNSALKKQIKYISKENAAINEKLKFEVEQLKTLVNWYHDQLVISKKKLYGKSAESVAQMYGQLSLFNEAESERAPLTPEPKLEDIPVREYKRKKKSTYKDKYENLPVKEVIYDIAPEDKICSKCGTELSFLKYDTRNELEIIPAQVIVVQHKKAVYVCKECDRNGIEGTFVSAEAELPLIEKSLVSPSFMSYILNQKFCNSVPLYRIEQDLKNMGVQLSRQTMSNWIVAGAKLLKPLYDEIKKELLRSEIIHADETPLEVLHEPNRPAETKSYMWVYVSGMHEERNIALYDYQEGRSGKFAMEYLSGYNGYLQCDGWSGYNKVEGVTRIGCWAHARRKFKDALDVQPDASDLTTEAGKAFLLIEEVFKSNQKYLGEITDDLKASVDNFFDWCHKVENEILLKSVLGKAVLYALNQEKTLRVFLENPKIEMTNNRAERAIKPFVIGRKNWLFCNTPAGACSSSTIYSIIETAKMNKLSPIKYLEWVFEQIRQKKFADISSILPWSDNIPTNIKN